MRRLTTMLIFLALVACGERHERPALEIGSVLSGDTAGYARAVSPRQFRFPRDHGPHPSFRSEWWYFTGNVSAAGGERFGLQLTFFRSALSSRSPAGESPWRSRQVYMAHFALTDGARGRFHGFERFSRGAAGLAGAQAVPFRVWLEDWAVSGAGPAAVPPMALTASQGNVAVDLRLEASKPPVLQGDGGLSRKGEGEGNASYYYSVTRMRAVGRVRVGGHQYDVSGTVWMDREWSTSVLEKEQVGWDWFALQLDDTTEVMVYHLRRRNGTPDPHSRGVVVDAQGRKVDLKPSQFQLEVLEHHRAPSGVRYPSQWRVRVPGLAIDVVVTPLVADQELDVSFRYWEGAVQVEGRRGARRVGGVGYVELTGYAKP
jgi:predicted secreted hydrolase